MLSALFQKKALYLLHFSVKSAICIVKCLLLGGLIVGFLKGRG